MGNGETELERYKYLYTKTEEELKAAKARLEIVQNELSQMQRDIFFYRDKCNYIEKKLAAIESHALSFPNKR